MLPSSPANGSFHWRRELRKMRFKVDENLPTLVAHLLQNGGHDAATLADQQMSGASDTRLAEVCQSEKRVIITLDLDFADIRAYPPIQYAGIIVLRPKVQSIPEILELTERIMPLLEIEVPDGALWIVQENGVRVREGE